MTKIDIHALTLEQFLKLPLVIEGASKEVRYAGNGQVVIRFKPTIYSFTANRSGIVPGSEILRLRATKRFIEVLRKVGIRHAYLDVSDHWVLADFVAPHAAEYAKYGLSEFVPQDMNSQVANLYKGPPIEVIVKRFHGGTSKHRYRFMSGTQVRDSHPLFRGIVVKDEGAYPAPMVRFDWRNPLQDGDGDRIADEILSDGFADLFIDVERARATALRVYRAMETFLGERNIVCNDLCLFITEDGNLVYGEISQDCGRFRHFDLGSLDKDVWRSGGSSDQVIEKWSTLLTHIGG